VFLLICSYVFDLISGDPEWSPHPVRGMGKLISFLDNRLRANAGKWPERIKGVILTLSVTGISVCFAYLLIRSSKRLNPFFGDLIWIYLGYTTLSIKDLGVKARGVLKEVERNSIVEARRQLSRIVGRDTQNLNKNEIITAAIESVAENTNDGIIAPIFYLILGGPVLAIAYKSINTLDSMVGYRNEKYLHFGWFSAKLDDIANFIPARISGFLISISALITGKRSIGSFRTMVTDGQKHFSPNSGISEAAMSGALGIRLGGTCSYQGRPFMKPYIGEEKIPVQSSFINDALVISFVTSLLMIFTGIILKWLI